MKKILDNLLILILCALVIVWIVTALRGNKKDRIEYEDIISSYLKDTKDTKPAEDFRFYEHNPDGEKKQEEPVKEVSLPLERTFTVNGVSFTMVLVEGGTFLMGATSAQGSDGSTDERPVHKVTLSSYYIGKTEVTQALWKAVIDSEPFIYKGDNLPVNTVSWNDCQSFISMLNDLTGRVFRLPTEAEWEYAARGGQKTKGYKYSGSNTLKDVAWYDDHEGGVHKVATKRPNELGIYDMSGNVREWCNDVYDRQYYVSSPSNNPQGPAPDPMGHSRVQRGGDFNDFSVNCRVSARNYGSPSYYTKYDGLRIAFSIETEVYEDL